MDKLKEIKNHYDQSYIEDYGDYETITIDKKDYDWLIVAVQYLTDELRTTENDVKTAYKALEYIECLAEITDDKRLMVFVKQGRGEVITMKDNREVPNGKRRNRCIICNKLTWSKWYLTYPKDNEYIQGFHCYECYDQFEKEFII